MTTEKHTLQAYVEGVRDPSILPIIRRDLETGLTKKLGKMAVWEVQVEPPKSTGHRQYGLRIHYKTNGVKVTETEVGVAVHTYLNHVTGSHSVSGHVE